jgi:hypothetical protein
MSKHLLNGLRFLLIPAAAGAAYHYILRPWTDRWGATDAELQRQWPGDELVRDSIHTSTHALTIQAPAAAIWPWIVQIGQDRAGYYSYTWLENLFRAEMRNIYRIVPEFQNRQVGDDVWMAPKYKYGGQARMTVALLEPNRCMVLVPPGDLEKINNGGEAEGTWAFILEPLNDRTTRLIMRGRSAYRPRLWDRFWSYTFWEPAHFIMERRMMLTIARLSQVPAAAARTREQPAC